MSDIWAELDKRLNEEPPQRVRRRRVKREGPSKPGECVYCPGKPVSGGNSKPSIAARKLGLCSICHNDTQTRRKRRRELAGVEA